MEMNGKDSSAETETVKRLGSANLQAYDKLAPYWSEYVNFPGRKDSYTFYTRLFRMFGIKDVLDIGCGVGDHATNLAKSGIKMCMCDLSPEMAKQAQKNAHEAGLGIDVRVADWTQLEEAYGHASFEGVMQTLTSIALNYTEQALRRNFESVWHILKPEGVYAFDIRNFSGYGLRTPADRCIVVDNNVFRADVHFAEPSETGLSKVQLAAFVTYNKLTGEKVTQYLRPWQPKQLVAALQKSGFKHIRIYHDFSLEQEKTNAESAGKEVKHIQIMAVKPAKPR